MALKQDVRQQNEATRARIASIAEPFRADPLWHPWLLAELRGRGLDPTTGILVSLNRVPEQGGEFVSGVWLTSDQRFFRFDAMLSYDRRGLGDFEVWKDVTVATEVNEHLRGTGKSFGWLAIEVLNELRLRSNTSPKRTRER